MAKINAIFNENKYAFVTVITNEKYIPGLKGLVLALKKVETQYPLVVLIPEDRFEIIKSKIMEFGFISNEKKQNNDFNLIFCKKPFIDIKKMSIFNKEHKHWEDTFFKLSSTLLVEYNKVILIDSDMLVLKNIDHLFEKRPFSAVNSGNAKWNGFYELNSGLIVIEPGRELFDRLTELIPIAKEKRAQLGYDVGDQDVIREYVKDYWANDTDLHLNEAYNLYIGHAKYYIKKNRTKDIYILHFVGSKKPWQLKKIGLIKTLLKCNCFYMFKWYIKYLKLLHSNLKVSI